MRCIRSQLESLITDIPRSEMAAMALGLAHSLSRYKLKFSPEKVDTMIVQAIALLDDLDKEMNNYVMRLREWYGWHFPELGRIVTDHVMFAKIVQRVGMRTNIADSDFSDILTPELEQEVKAAAETSMGTEISDGDVQGMNHLCSQILMLQKYRLHLNEYLGNRMLALAPNLTVLMGEMVGARLIARAGKS
ncbi:unnamed protein product [Soboliphyme baturini]|uniref:Nop domain-containing protein n=1 Tax=Soboliphyme baturini TaxID=241478 RepID=A0A183J9T2_9BILA|nr:unnamed protein product [Soboliphyme baturini]